MCRQRSQEARRRMPLIFWIASLVTGCTSPLFRAQSPDAETDIVAISGPTVPFVRDLSAPIGLGDVEVQSVALLTGLTGTGSDPPPSPQRDSLISEMQTHGVHKIGDLLASPNTSMVLVRGFLPPGIQKDDTFDVEIQLPPRSETTSLRGGWLMQSRMREYRMMNDSSQHSGHVVALTQGPVLMDSLFDKASGKTGDVRGRILGGGISMQTRPLGLMVRSEHTSVRTSSLIGAAINARFHIVDRRSKAGVAKPKDDNYIELALHPLYKNNVGRYLNVVGSISVGETASDQARRLDLLQRKLLEPTSAGSAALQLEAIGKTAIPVLKMGIASGDPEVRFYSAEALAYLDDEDAAKPLSQAAQNERAFRWRALTALSVMEHGSAYDGLTELFNVSSAETRYGAFRALRTRQPSDALVAGEILGEEFGLHEILAGNDPMIHFARARRQEVVVFGQSPRMSSPTFLYAGPKILLKAGDGDQIRVSRFEPGKEDRQEICSTKVADIIRTIVKIGGNYADVMECMLAAKERGFLTARVEVDAMPRRGREFIRPDIADSADEAEPHFRVTNSVPDLFIDRLNTPIRTTKDEVESGLDYNAAAETQKPKGIFGRMSSWFSR